MRKQDLEHKFIKTHRVSMIVGVVSQQDKPARVAILLPSLICRHVMGFKDHVKFKVQGTALFHTFLNPLTKDQLPDLVNVDFIIEHPSNGVKDVKWVKLDDIPVVCFKTDAEEFDKGNELFNDIKLYMHYKMLGRQSKLRLRALEKANKIDKSDIQKSSELYWQHCLLQTEMLNYRNKLKTYGPDYQDKVKYIINMINRGLIKI